MDLFDKSISDIEKDDIEWIIEEQLPEDERLEFKRTLSSQKNQTEPWLDGKDNVGKIARKDIIKEVVAFANTDGGYLLLGIQENEKEDLNVADDINLIPRVEKLAEYFREYFWTQIEPRINNIQCVGIPLDDNDAGVLVIFVETSNYAPHRSKIDKECYVRRNDKSEPMNMREIRDLILLRRRSREDIEKELNNSQAEFRSLLKANKLPFEFGKELHERLLGLNITLLPINQELAGERIYNKLTTEILTENIVINVDGNKKLIGARGAIPYREYPIIKGTRFYGDRVNIDVHDNGLIKIYFILDEEAEKRNLVMFLDWYLVLMYNGLKIADQIKQIYQVFNMEYAITSQIVTNTGEFEAKLFRFDDNSVYLDNIVETTVQFPEYSYADEEEIIYLMNEFALDYCNMAHIEFDNEIIDVTEEEN